MNRTVGLVCEGPRDRELIEDLISSFFPNEEISYRYLQPEPSLNSHNYNGWTGVLRWCRKDYPILTKANLAISNRIDLLVIQMDGDVSRDSTNKKSHCICENVECQERKKYRSADLVCAEDCIINVNFRYCGLKAEK